MLLLPYYYCAQSVTKNSEYYTIFVIFIRFAHVIKLLVYLGCGGGPVVDNYGF